MSRAWIAFYMGDYDKDTQALSTIEHGAYFLLLKQCWVHGSIPQEAAKRANITKMSLRDWNKIAPTINSFFNEDGTQKRATKEIEKAEQIRLKRAIAGQLGGIKSGVSKAIRKGMDSKYEANANQTMRQNALQQGSPAKPNHNSKLESFLVSAREPVDLNKQSGSSLATALPEGALREEPSGGGLVAALERTGTAARVGHPPGRPCWVDWETPEWAAHDHWRRSRAWKPPTTMTRVQDGVELTGNWFETRVPSGYDEATGECLAPSQGEDAA